jgi:hypothetical protein
VAAGVADAVVPLDLIAGRLVRVFGRDALQSWKHQ